MMVGCQPDVQPVNAQNDVILLGGGTTGGVTPPPAITDPNGGTTDAGNIDANGDTTIGDTTGGDDGSTLLPTGVPTPVTEPTTDGGTTSSTTTPEVEDERKIVNLKMIGIDSAGIKVSPKGQVVDNHGRISCFDGQTTCHTTYFAGTEVALTAPISAILIKGSALLRGSLRGFECNSSFQAVDIPNLNLSITFTIQEDMECVPVYTF